MAKPIESPEAITHGNDLSNILVDRAADDPTVQADALIISLGGDMMLVQDCTDALERYLGNTFGLPPEFFSEVLNRCELGFQDAEVARMVAT